MTTRRAPSIQPAVKPAAATTNAAMTSATAIPARRLAARGRQIPFSGHCESPCRRPKPQAFIMPTWQSEKSNRTGSTGIDRAQRRRDLGGHLPPGRRVVASSRRQRPSRMTCVSSGTTSRRRRARASRRQDRPHRGAPSSAGTGSAVCTRCPPTDAERSSRRPGASAPAVGRPEIERERAARESCRAHSPTSARRRIVALQEECARSFPRDRASAAGSTAARPDRARASSGAPSPGVRDAAPPDRTLARSRRARRP